MLEAYTTLGFLAAHTETVRLGALVTGVTYRHPGLLAKIVTTLDVLSGGRAALGIGAAWYDREHEGLGVPFPPIAERFERLEETLRICLADVERTTTGRSRARTTGSPRPCASPRPGQPPRPRDHDRRQRRAEDPAPGRPLRATPATCSPPRRRRSRTSSTCCAATATPRGATTTRSARRVAYMGEPATEGDLEAFTRDITGYGKLGIDTVILAPRIGAPAEWIERFVAPAVQRLAELD